MGGVEIIRKRGEEGTLDGWEVIDIKIEEDRGNY